MNRTGAVFFEHFKMQLGAVAFVLIEAIIWVFFVVAQHEAISGDLRDNRGCHAGKYSSVCLYNSFLGYGEIEKKVSINNQKIYLPFSFVQCTLQTPYCFYHCTFGGLENVDFVDHLF